MFVATNSDSAALQKIMNRLIEDYEAIDHAKYGTANAATFDIKSLSGVSLDSASNADRDYLSIMTSNTNLDEDDFKDYHHCSEVTNEHQIGSRYFVTAANAMKIIFLREAVIEF
uniref:Uncharacterized protein n=1 Tax=Amphimedon queenslandica TaxID=400682 RepID=A0A1X7TYP2_AMPQE